MPTTLNPTCPLCGLRYTDRSLLELHIREDHRPRERREEPAPGGSGHAATSPSRPGRSGPSWAKTVLHRVILALRYTNDELLRAYAALSRGRRVSGPDSDRIAGGGRA